MKQQKVTSCYVLMGELPDANFPGKSAMYSVIGAHAPIIFT